MKTKIEVENIEESRQIRLGLSDPAVRAFVQIMGTLSTVKSQRAKERVLTFLKDCCNDMCADPH